MKKNILFFVFIIGMISTIAIQNANAVSCKACSVTVDCPGSTMCAVTYTDSGAFIECSNGTIVTVPGCGEQDS